MDESKPVTELNKNLFISSGGRRDCYRHPDDDSLCIKVLKQGLTLDKQAAREIKYHTIYKKTGTDHSYLAGFHGQVSTNLGKGLVFDLVTNDNGQISTTLAHHLKSQPLSNYHSHLQELKGYLLQNKIHLSDLSADNILVKQTTGDFKLVLIDGVVNSDLIKICDYSEYFRKKKIHRKWQRFEQELKLN